MEVRELFNFWFLIYSCVQDVDLQIFTFKDYGKNFVKAIKVSPDGFIQNAIQLAYYKYIQRKF